MIRSAPARLSALIGGVMATALAAAPAQASAGHPTASAALSQPWVAITSMTPNIAGPKSKVVVSGTVTNPAGSAVSGVTVRLWSSGSPLTSRDAMDSYLTDQAPTGMDQVVPSAVWTLASVLGPHASRRWSLTLPVAQLGMSQFGVYPVAAQLYEAGTPVGSARTFLPFWPGRSERRVLKRVNIAWVWPLIAAPQQAACPALLSSHLSASVAGNGRLGELLAAGRTPDALRAHLTWAIDPSLLNDVNVMTRPYRTGGRADCSGGTTQPTSASARDWLAGVRDVTAQQDYFVTPYADVDVAALARHGLDNELASAFKDGRETAQKILGKVQSPEAPAAGGGPGWIAWPAGGIADYTALQALAANNVATVILSSTMMPPSTPVPFTASALTTTPNGLGSQLDVLLADDSGAGSLARILATPPGQVPGVVPGEAAGGTATTSPSNVSSPPQAAAFAREQWFLAETAMIAAEYPAVARDLVVTPPRRWDPGTKVADALLADTVNAPWLRPVSVASMVSAGPVSGRGRVHRREPPQNHRDRRELTRSLLRQVRHLVSLTQLEGSIFKPSQPDFLSRAVAAVESSAWRGRAGQRQAEALLRQVAAYVSDQLQQVSIVNPVRVTLGGKSSPVPVSIRNNLHRPVSVRLKVTVPHGDRVHIGRFPQLVTVHGRTQKTIKIPVRASVAGTFTLHLQLTTPGGKPLHGKPTPLTVEATHFGTLALVIIGVALLIFVLTAAGRAIRRGGRRTGNDPGDPAEPADPAVPAGPAEPAGWATPTPEATEEVDETRPDAVGALTEADTVEPERANGAHPAKEPDDQASTPRRAGKGGHF